MNKLPDGVLKYFWGDSLEELSWKRHKHYIAKTLLEKGDRNALKWLLGIADKKYLRTLVNEKKLDKKSKNFWNIYLS